VLLVDDEVANLDLLEALLGEEGYRNLLRTTDPREVTMLAERHAADLVLLDLHMPHRHGLDVLADLRAATPEGEYRPVLVLTADVTGDARDRALTLGARDFVTKPFDAAEVLLRVENLLDTRVLHLAERRARARAEAAESRAALLAQERERLLAIVAHDLRNPLGAIAMYAEVLASLQAGDADPYVRGALATIHASAAGMQRLVEDLLDAASLRGGALRAHRTEQRLGEVFDEAERMLRPLAEAAGVGFVLQPESGAPARIVSLDARRLVQLLSNLVSNAVKFTPPGGTVTVHYTVTADGLHASVTDTGPGISADDLPHLFTAFWRGDRGGRDAHRGVGLGLWIARAIVEGHGGALGVETRPEPGPAQGTTVHFTVPFTDARRWED
jgi:signal transduction histidine kinase